MYRNIQNVDVPAEEFKLPFEGQLSAENRWVIMSKLIPWSEYESEYAEHFSPEMGAPAKSFRMALGSLIIQEKLGISDRETVEQIRENPYLQYFIGLKNYHAEPPFDASMMVHFRQRIGEELIGKINLRMVQKARLFGNESTGKQLEVGVVERKEPPNRGKTINRCDGGPSRHQISHGCRFVKHRQKRHGKDRAL